MNRAKKIFLAVLSTLAITAGALGVASCGNKDKNPSAQDSEIRQVYATYVTYMEAQGQSPLSYEEWLASIKGEKGEDGKSAYQIWLENGHTGTQGDFLNWLKGEKGDQGEQGEKGDDGEAPTITIGANGNWYINGEDTGVKAKGDKGDKGVGIEKVEYDENGDLKITFTDGSTQTVKAPERHVHTFGEWTAFTNDDTPCENRLFLHVCTECNTVEWKQGSYADHNWTVVTTPPTCQAQGYDTKTCDTCGKVEKNNYTAIVAHPWTTQYSQDASYHWYDCTTCDDIKGKEEHTDNGEGVCVVCDYLIGPTAGVLYDVTDGKARVVGYEGTATRVRIAETYNGAPVTEICSNAFSWCSSLTSVTIGDSVTSIGEYAFYDCDSLTSVYITDIAAWCNISFDGYYANPLYHANNLYLNNELVTDLVIPDSVTSIGNYAFYNCDSLRSVTIGYSVTSIGSYAFYYCSSLTGVAIGDSVTNIGGAAFYGCNLIHNQYGYATYLAVEGNPHFALLALTNENFSTYTIHEDTKIIANQVFYDCSRLTSVEIPDSVTSIGEYAFYDCDSLTSLYYKGTSEEWSKSSIGSNNDKLKNATRYYYSENEPTESGNYWHYVDGVPTKWE